MNQKWIYAFIAMAMTMLVMFPLNFLWVGMRLSSAFIISLMFSIPVLLIAWNPGARRTPAQRKSGGDTPAKPVERMPRVAKIGLGVILAILLAVFITVDISSEGMAAGVTKAIGLVLIILATAIGLRLGYLKDGL